MNLYLAILPLFKSFILIFEQKQPMCHRIDDEMMDLFKHFLCLFLIHEVMKDKTSKQLKTMDVKNVQLHLPVSAFFIWQ
jgi:hypothetical protein